MIFGREEISYMVGSYFKHIHVEATSAIYIFQGYVGLEEASPKFFVQANLHLWIEGTPKEKVVGTPKYFFLKLES